MNGHVHSIFAELLRPVPLSRVPDPEPEDVEALDGPDYDDPDDLLG